MRETKAVRKPELRSALSTPFALIATAIAVPLAILARYGASLEIILAAMALLFGPPLVWVSFFQKDDPVPRGRVLRIEEGLLRQFDQSGKLVSEIDATQAFQYRVFNPRDGENSRIRLYQNGTRLSFYPTDPGGLEAIREIVQIQWPPRPRVSAGYSG